MASIPAPERKAKQKGGQSGIALFMVIASMSVLSVLVTEFVYIAQMNQTVAYDGLDQLKAHYLAKSGYKLSLLRLKAFQQVKSAMKSMGGGAGGAGGGAAGVSKSLIDKIWSFPFFYPIPTDLPGLSIIQKDSIAKFQKESGLEGNFSAVIESESSKYNLNSIHAAFLPSPSPAPSGSPGGNNSGANGQDDTPNPTPGASASPTPFDPEQARASLREYLLQLYQSKLETDDQFSEEYRDWRFEDFIDGLFAYSDPTYQAKVQPPSDAPTLKKAPFYAVSELRMVPGMEDAIYDLFAPALTASTTPGINVNTLREPTLRALFPQLTKEEVEEFFKHRDSEETDNTFKTADDFFKYVGGAFQQFVKDPNELTRFKTSLEKRNIRIIVDESEFKITVTAKVNNSTRVLEAWVTLNEPKTAPTANTPGGAQQPQAAPAPTKPDAGLRVTFMRIL